MRRGDAPRKDTEMQNIKIEVRELACNVRQAKALLVVDPEKREVYTWSHVGAGVPMPVYEGRHFACNLSNDVDIPSLRKVLESEEAQIFLGAMVDAYHMRETDDDDLQFASVMELFQTFVDNVPRHTDAAEWLGWDGGEDSAEMAVGRGLTLTEVAEEEIKEAAEAGYLIKLDDMRDEIDSCARERLCSVEDEIDDEDPDEDLIKLRDGLRKLIRTN